MAQAYSSRSTVEEAAAHRTAGRMERAEQVCREGLADHPDDAALLHFLGMICCESGRHSEALELIGRVVAGEPGNERFQNNFGTVLGRVGRDDEAAKAFERALKIRPGYADAYGNLAAAMQRLGHFVKAEAAARRMIAMRPAHSAGYVHLACALGSLGRCEEGIANFRRAIELDRRSMDAWKGLLAALESAGLIEAALEAYQQAIVLFPNNAGLQSARLYLLHCRPAITPDEVFEEHVNWGHRVEATIAKYTFPPVAGCIPGRPIRLGYISADFREHPSSRFVEPILENHDRRAFQVYCYSDVAHTDAVTERCRRLCNEWRNVRDEPDGQVAQQIRQDEIDILIDTTGHMAGSRLRVFAHRPAPVQVSLPMYPGTTGLAMIDYFFSDDLCDPPRPAENLYVEKLLRISPIGRCYRPDEISPDTIPLPAEKNACITFAALNRLSKVTDEMISSWAQIVQAVPGCRLKILVEGPGGVQTSPIIVTRFARLGLAHQNIEFVGRQSRELFLQALASCDISLDTYPYNGCTTTCDSIWMGTPVVSLFGRSHVSRVGLSLLTQVGLADLAVAGRDSYVKTAISLANERAKLKKIRTDLRQKMRISAITDAAGLTQRLEQSLRRIWVHWCINQLPLNTL